MSAPINALDIIAKRKQAVASAMKDRAAQFASMRPSQPSVQSSVAGRKIPHPTMDWSCSACTFQNNAHAVSCSVCSTAKPGLLSGGRQQTSLAADADEKVSEPKWVCPPEGAGVWAYKGTEYIRDDEDRVWTKAVDEDGEPSYGEWVGKFVPKTGDFDKTMLDPRLYLDEDDATVKMAEQLSLQEYAHEQARQQVHHAVASARRTGFIPTWQDDLLRLYDDITQQIPGWQSCYQHLNQYRFDELTMQLQQSIEQIARTEVPLAIRYTFAITECGSSNPDQSISGRIYLITNETLYTLTMFVKDAIIKNAQIDKWMMLGLSMNHAQASAWGTMPYGQYYGFVPLAKLTDASIRLLNKVRHLFGYVGKASNTFTSHYFDENKETLQENMDKIHETILAMCD